MNKRTQRKRITVSSKPTAKKKRRQKSKVEGFKKRLNLLIIWTLVVVNGVLIFSLVQKIVQMPGMAGTMKDAPKDLPVDPLTMTVLNGCGVQGLAAHFRDILIDHRYDVRVVGNADDIYNETVLIDSQKRPEAEVEELRKLIGLDKEQVIPLKSSDYSTDVQLILGQDYTSLKLYRSNH